MTIARSNTFEGGTNGSTITAGTSGGASGDAFTTVGSVTGSTQVWSNAQTMHGGLSAALTGSTTTGGPYLQWSSLGGTAQGAFRFYFYAGAAPPAAMQIATIANVGTLIGRLIFTNSPWALGWQDASGTTVWNSGYTILANTWYRIEVGFTPGNPGTVTVTTYLGDSTTSVNTWTSSTVNVSTTTFERVTFGRISGSWTSTLYFDDLAVSTDSSALIGPSLQNYVKNPADTVGLTDGVSVTMNGSSVIQLNGTPTSIVASNTVGSVTGAVPAGANVGEVLLAHATSGSSANAIIGPTGWTTLAQQTDANASCQWVGYRIVDGTESATYTWTYDSGSVTTQELSIYRLSGVDTTMPMRAVNTTYNVSGSASSMASSPNESVGPNDVLFSFWSGGSTAGTTQSTPTFLNTGWQPLYLLTNGGKVHCGAISSGNQAFTAPNQQGNNAGYGGASIGGMVSDTTTVATSLALRPQINASAPRQQFVAAYEPVSPTATGTLTGFVTADVGDLLVYTAWSPWGNLPPVAPTGGGLTWTLAAQANSTHTSGNAEASVWYARATRPGTFLLTGTVSGTVGSNPWYWQVQRWQNATIANTWSISGSSGGQLSFTTAQANSSLAMLSVDYNANAPSTGNYTTATAGAFTPTYQWQQGTYWTAYAGYYNIDGAAGSKTVGSSTASQLSAMVVLELTYSNQTSISVSPGAINGLRNRWRADKIITLYGSVSAAGTGATNNSAISTLPALNGTQNFAQSTSGNQPTLLSSGIGSQPTVHFNGSTGYLTTALNSAGNAAQPFTISMVVKLNAISTAAWSASSGGALLDASGQVELLVGNTNQFDAYAGVDLQPSGATTTGNHVLTWVVNGGSSVLYQDGTALITGNSGGGALNYVIGLGAQTSGTRFANADIAEVNYFGRVLTSAELAKLDTYYYNQYGIVSSDATVGTNYTAAPADNEGITDAPSFVQNQNQTYADNVGLTDAVTVVRTVTQTYADNVGITDAGVLADEQSATSAGPDSVGITDAVTALRFNLQSPADNVGLTDAVTFVQSQFKTVADNVGITDVGSPSRTVQVTQADNVGVTDTPTTKITIVRTAADSIGISDAQAVFGSITFVTKASEAIDIEIASPIKDVAKLSANAGVQFAASTANLTLGAYRANTAFSASGTLTHVVALSTRPTGTVSPGGEGQQTPTPIVSTAGVNIKAKSPLRVVARLTDVLASTQRNVYQQLSLGNGPIYNYTTTNYAVMPNFNRQLAAGLNNGGGLVTMGGSPPGYTSAYSTDAPTGYSYSLANTVTSVGTGTNPMQRRFVSANTKLNAGDVVSWAMWIKLPRTDTLSPYAEGAQADNSTYWGTTGGGSVSVPGGVWTRFTGTFTVTAGQNGYYLNGCGFLGSNTPQVGDVTKFGACTITINGGAPVAASWDGDSTSTASDAYAWTGTPGYSTSTDTVKSATGALSAAGPTGQSSWTLTRNENSQLGWGAYLAANIVESISAGASVQISVWYKVGGGSATLYIYDDPASSSPVTGGVLGPLIADGTWHQYVTTVTLTGDWKAGIHRLRSTLPTTGNVANDYVTFSDAQVQTTAPLRIHYQQPALAEPVPEEKTNSKMAKTISRIFGILR